jgi:hypothetical protein
MQVVPRFLSCCLVVFTCLLLCASAASMGLNQAASPAPAPTPPPSAPNVPAVTQPNQPTPAPTGTPSGQPGNAGNSAAPAIDPRLGLALNPITHTPPPSPQRPPAAGQGTFILDWASGSATPDTIYHTGNSIIRLANVNDILFSYQVTVTEIKTSTDDLSQLPDLIKELNFTVQKTNAIAKLGSCQLDQNLLNTQKALTDIQSKLDAFFPKTSGSAKCSSVPVARTIADWGQIRASYDRFETSLGDVQRELGRPECQAKESDGGQPQNIAPAIKLLLDDFPALRDRVVSIQNRVDAPHVLDVNYSLKRTSDYDIAVSETCNGAATDHAAVTFHLNRGFDVLTLSGGFLMTKLQARSYSVVAEPTPPPPGSPPGTPPGTQNVLGVDGLGSGMRAALVALLNYHDPFEWFGNKPNFGLSVSAGPAFDISQGKADTSKFGVFVGGSVHLWNRLFITPGVHFGEFADFPPGFHFAGDPVPANFGTPNPTKRWTGHFAFAITFKGKDLTNLTPGSNNSNPTPAPPAPSTPK